MTRPEPLDAAALVDRLKHGGQASASEVQSLQAALDEGAESNDVYNLTRALALGAAPTTENVQRVSQHLACRDDWTLQGVIYALGYWDLTGDFLDEILKLADYPSWRTFPYASIAAIAALGAFTKKTKSARVCSFLVDAFDGVSRKNEGDGTITADERQYRDAVYQAIITAVRGRREATIGSWRSNRPTDPSVIQDARRMAKRR